MPPRKGSQKVKTGCRTCKTRKVKCDEGKPACHRCTVAGRVCGGYESAAEQGLSWYRPRQLTAYDEREGRAFHFFTRMVGPVLSGPMDAYFWTHLVMQFSHFQPAVRHAVYAISSLYEDFHRGQRLVRHRQSNVFAIGHYTAAIQEIKSANDEQLMMLLCVLFICIEYLQGDPVAAMRHCQYGIHILNKSGCSPWVREHLLPLFRRLSSSPFLLGGRVISVPGLDVIGYDSPTPKSFTNLAEAESTLDYLVHQAIALVRASQGEDHYRQGDLEAQLIEWHRVLTELEATLPPSTENQLAICTMRMRYEIVKIRVNMAFEHAETMYDNHLDDFQYVVDLARQAAQLKTELGVGLPSSPGVELAADPKPSFIFESGFLPLLYCVAIRCRKLDTRMEALDLMARLSVAKENIFDVGSLYRVGRRLIEFEHGIDLADRAAVQMAMSAPLPAEERRVTDVALDHEPEVRTDEMTGRTTYRRRFWFMMRDPVTGEIHGLEQHVSDELPPHMGVVVPSIRCAIPA